MKNLFFIAVHGCEKTVIGIIIMNIKKKKSEEKFSYIVKSSVKCNNDQKR